MLLMKSTMTVLLSGLLATVLTASGKEWIKNGDFENEKTAPWFFSPPAKTASLSIIKDSNLPGGGSGALGITVANTRRVDVRQSLKAGPGKYKLTMYIDTTRCTKPSGYVMVQLTGSVGKKWKAFATVATPYSTANEWIKLKWKKYEKIITVPQGGELSSFYIVLVNITGTVMVDRISLLDYNEDEQKKDQELKDRAAAMEAAQKAAPQAAFRSKKYQNLFRINETPEHVFELSNPADREVSVPVSFTTTDYFGRTVRKTDKEFKIPAKGKVSEALRYPECRLPGFYCTTASWKSGIISGELKASFVKVGPVPQKNDPLFGITHYFNLGFHARNAELMESLAVGSKGIIFPWNWYLKDFLTNKTKTFEKIRQNLEDLKKCGIEPVGGFDMNYGAWKRDAWKRWMPKEKVKGEDPTVEELQEVLVPFIEKIVTLYKPYIKNWELGGELDCGYQNYAAAYPNYIGMMKFSAEAIRRIDPDAVICGIGCGGMKSHPQYQMITRVLPEVKDYLDGISPDLYPAGNRYGKGFVTLNSEENNFRPSMLKLVEMAKVTKKQYVSCAEGGPSIVRSTPLDDPCGATMANVEARQFILLKTVPNFRHWLYYKPFVSLKGSYDWSMWEKENPRQVVSAYAATARIMAFAEFVKELKLHQDIPCWMFRKDGKYFAAIWYNGKENLKVKLPDNIPAEAKDVQGNPIELKDSILYLGEAPVYLYAKNPAALEKLLADASAGVSELEFVLDRQQAGKTLLAIKNKSGHKIDLTLKSAEIPETKTIPYSDKIELVSGEIKTVEKPVGADSVTFHLETGKGRKYAASAVLKPVKVPFVNSFAELEKKAVPQRLDDPSKQITGYDDLKTHGVYTGLDDLSGSFRLGYDKQYLYLEARVKDNVHLNNCSPGFLYMGDSIQFAIDTNRDAKMKLFRGVRGYSDDDFNFVSGLVKGKPYTWCFVAPTKKSAELRDKQYRLNPEITRDEKTKTTLYRIKLAFSDLAPLKPEKGRNFGFSLIIFDKDTSTSFYSMEYSAGVSHPFEPSKYPAFQFE